MPSLLPRMSQLGVAVSRDIVKEHRGRVTSWKPRKGVWALLYGTTVATVCAAGSSYSILFGMRRFFGLHTKHHLGASVIPVVAFSSVACYMAWDLFIDRDLIMRFSAPVKNKPFCSTCFEVRGTLIQVFYVLVLTKFYFYSDL